MRKRSRSADSRKFWPVLLEAWAFASIIALSWADELLSLPRMIFGGEHLSNWREAAMETLVVLVVATPVLLATKNIVARLHYLEGFLRVCAWCRRTECEGEWVATELFLAQRLDTHTTHGICPACTQKVRGDFRAGRP